LLSERGVFVPRNKTGSSSVLAAFIVGGSILAGSWMVTSSLDRTSTGLTDIKTGLAETKSALEAVAKARPAGAPTRRGPDPGKVHTVNTKGSPAKGPDTAQVKIIEFSDFQ
jgi:hypothetical protein